MPSNHILFLEDIFMRTEEMVKGNEKEKAARGKTGTSARGKKSESKSAPKRKNNGISELVFIIDSSGSMSGFESDTIGGFNSMISSQRSKEGTVYVSTILFANYSITRHDRKLIDFISPMMESEYVVGGCTALYDAVGDAIKHISSVHSYIRPEDVPSNTVFIITTDGLENASRRYDAATVKRMILEKERECGWEFIFLGANIDSFEAAREIGIRKERAANYMQSKDGYVKCYRAMDEFVSIKRCAPDKTCGDEWKKGLDED